MKINFIIDRFESGKAVLKTDGGEEITWPKDKLPAEAAESGVLCFEISTKEAEEKKREQTAKDILNEILDA